MFEFLFFLSYMKSNTIKTLSIIGLSICLILFRVTDGAEGTLHAGLSDSPACILVYLIPCICQTGVQFPIKFRCILTGPIHLSLIPNNKILKIDYIWSCVCDPSALVSLSLKLRLYSEICSTILSQFILIWEIRGMGACKQPRQRPRQRWVPFQMCQHLSTLVWKFQVRFKARQKEKKERLLNV